MIITRYSPALMSIFAGFSAISGKADDNFRHILTLIVIQRWWTIRHSQSPRRWLCLRQRPISPRTFTWPMPRVRPKVIWLPLLRVRIRISKNTLLPDEPVDGYSIASIEWSDRVGATKVTISNDGKFATLTFNQALLSQRAAPNVPPALDQLPQSVPLLPSSVPIQAPGDRVPNKNKQKPGAAA